MGKVSFFPLKFEQTQEELDRLDMLQAEIKQAFTNIKFIENQSAYQYILRKENLHNKLRDSIKMVGREPPTI